MCCAVDWNRLCFAETGTISLSISITKVEYGDSRNQELYKMEWSDDISLLLVDVGNRCADWVHLHKHNEQGILYSGLYQQCERRHA